MHPKRALARFSNLLMEARDYAVLEKTFIYQRYVWTYKHIRPGTIFIDVGAYIGDTAVYFATNQNTRRVIAYEAVPYYYLKALSNIKKSPFKDKIQLFNVAILDQGGKMKIAATYTGHDWGFDSSKNRGLGGKNVEVKPLSEVISDLKNLALKCYVDYNGGSTLDGLKLNNVYLIDVIVKNGNVGKIKQHLMKEGFKTHEFTNPNWHETHIRGIKK